MPRSGVNAARGGVEEAAVTSHYVSRCLTTFAPQPLHKPGTRSRFPWSEGFDRIFRNEGVTGSNPVSSTKTPWSGRFLSTALAWWIGIPRICRSTGGPQELAPEAPHMQRGAFSLHLTNRMPNLRLARSVLIRLDPRRLSRLRRSGREVRRVRWWGPICCKPWS